MHTQTHTHTHLLTHTGTHAHTHTHAQTHMHTTLTGPAWAQMLVEAGGKDLLMLTDKIGCSCLHAAAFRGHNGMAKVRQGMCRQIGNEACDSHSLAAPHTRNVTHTQTHAHTHKHIHNHTHTDRVSECVRQKHTHTHTRTHTYTHIHTHTCTCTHIHTCTHTCTHLHTHTYINTHMHTHIVESVYTFFDVCLRTRNWGRGCAFPDPAGLVPMVRNSNWGRGGEEVIVAI